MSRADPLTFKFGQPLFAAAWPCDQLLLVAGGGGKPGSGIENRIIAGMKTVVSSVWQNEMVRRALSGYHVGAVHDARTVQNSIVEAFTALQQRVTALRYSSDGKLLVLGTQAGDILVFHASRYRQIASHQLRGPGEEPIASEIKDLDVCTSADDPTCLQLCLSADNGNGYVATVRVTTENDVPTRSELVSCIQLKKPKKIENGSIKHARFAHRDVVASINYRGNGYICRWQALRGGLFRQAALSASVPAAITGMDVSRSGDLLGLANAEGHSLLLQSHSLAVSLRNKKAHMVFGTDVAFAPHCTAFLSVSGDASARVNLVPQPRSTMGPVFWLLACLCLALAALVMLEERGMLTGDVGARLSPVAHIVRRSYDAAADGFTDRIHRLLESPSVPLR